MTIKQIEGYSIYMNKILGKGSYGSVYIGRKEHTHDQVAVKILPKEHSNSLIMQSTMTITSRPPSRTKYKYSKNYTQKISSCSTTSWSHPKTTTSSRSYAMATSPRKLKRATKGQKKKPSKCSGKSVTGSWHSSRRASFIGTHPHPRRDLKPANIMKKGHLLKLGDFGFAKQMENKSQMVATMVGTPLYMSIEILKGESYTSKCDIWALGFIFYELLHGETPWTAHS